jgi:hypothetical protein
MNKNKGSLQFMWLLGGALLVIMPIIVGLVLTRMVPDMPSVAYYIVGYVIMMALDFLLVVGIMRLPLPIALLASVLLPFLQIGIAVSAVTGGG